MERRKPQERFDTPLPITSPLSPEEIALEVAEAARAVALHETEATQSTTISRKRQAEFDPPSSTNKIRDTTTDQRAELDASDELTWLMWKQFDQFDLEDTSNRDPKSTPSQPPVSSVTYQNTDETTPAKDIKMSQRLKRRMDEESDYVPDPYPFGFLERTSPEETSGYQYSDFHAPVMDGLFQTLSMGPGSSPSLPLNKSSPLESMSSQSTDNHLMSGMNPTPSNTSSSLFGTSFGQESVAGDISNGPPIAAAGNISFVHGMNSTNTTNNFTKHEWKPSFVGTSQDNIHPALRDNATIVKPFDFQLPQFAMKPSWIGIPTTEADQSSQDDPMEEGDILNAPPAPHAANAPSHDDQKPLNTLSGLSIAGVRVFGGNNNTAWNLAPDERPGFALRNIDFNFQSILPAPTQLLADKLPSSSTGLFTNPNFFQPAKAKSTIPHTINNEDPMTIEDRLPAANENDEKKQIEPLVSRTVDTRQTMAIEEQHRVTTEGDEDMEDLQSSMATLEIPQSSLDSAAVEKVDDEMAAGEAHNASTNQQGLQAQLVQSLAANADLQRRFDELTATNEHLSAKLGRVTETKNKFASKIKELLEALESKGEETSLDDSRVSTGDSEAVAEANPSSKDGGES
ncbi:uncharacterized protein PAC_19848 [Phialocephala subalpina]|uniref:Uncharacterized protein n=1 Tax=Phialocephala subalpina TaxID=576137 RepID=A0A1L7XY50_9HELO|nr:uncharacterized protein PAC_19848 [Phialocephala subalpina]